MRAAIFNPYLDTLGGGERYTLTFAQSLLDSGWMVDIEWKNQDIKQPLEKRFGMDLSKINFIPDVKKGNGYDLCFWVSDGSIPLIGARKNFLHFQVPFHDVNGNNLINKMKLFRINKIICNSFFTKNVIDKEYGVDSIVVYPPTDTLHMKPKKKEDLILSVGRFSQLKQSKHQDVLVEAFKKMYDGGEKRFKLIIAGGVEVGAGDYVEKLKYSSRGYPIKIIESPSFPELTDLYGKSKFFWSASGFGVNESKNPEKVEHFGIVVVEAMSAGSIPIVFNAGGHKEIIGDGKDGALWNTIDDLIYKTLEYSQNSIWKKMSIQAKIKSKTFSEEEFKNKVLSII